VKIYTRTGDEGLTGLLGPGRVSKDAPRIEAYGTVDELNAVLGLARAAAELHVETDTRLGRIQDELFAVGAVLADPDPAGRFHSAITADHILRLETEIDAMESELEPLSQFILPGGSPAAAAVHLARTVCRRAERAVVHLRRQPSEPVPAELVVYLNRLSDWLFVLARDLNLRAGVADVPWGGLT
jgi:cob(I)alamin adenosyltransferase